MRHRCWKQTAHQEATNFCSSVTGTDSYTPLVPPKLTGVPTRSLKEERNSGCRISSITPRADLVQQEKICWSYLCACVCVRVTMCSGFWLFKLLASVLCKCASTSVHRNKSSLPWTVHSSRAVVFFVLFGAVQDAFRRTDAMDVCRNLRACQLAYECSPVMCNFK